MLRGAVFGFGNMGQKFTRFVNQSPEIDAEIIVAVNRGERNLSIATGQYGLAGTHSVQEALEMKPDFVLIASTSVAHSEQVIAAAAAGCHIFCEKPIALDLTDANAMIEAVQKAGVISVVNYIMRFNPAYIHLKELIDAGELGDLLSVTHNKTRGYGLYAGGARHRAIVEPHDSGGWAVHHATHDLDLFHWLAGPFATVYGLVLSTAPEGMSEEVVDALIRYQSGATGAVADSVCILRNHYTRVIGSKASVVITGENDECRFLLHREGEPEGTRAPEVHAVQDRKREGGGLTHFFECIESGHDSPHNIFSARHSLSAALALQESAQTGRAVVPA